MVMNDKEEMSALNALISRLQRVLLYYETNDVVCGMRKTNPVRRLCLQLVMARWFEMVMLIATILNTAFLCFYDPLKPDAWGTKLSQTSGIYFALGFSVEMIIKLVSSGFRGPTSYFRDGWNCLDAVVVAACWISIIPGVPNFSAIRILRLLHALIALPGLEIVFKAITRSVPGIANVSI